MLVLGFRPALVPRGAVRAFSLQGAGHQLPPKIRLRPHAAAEAEAQVAPSPQPLPPLQEGTKTDDASGSSPPYSISKLRARQAMGLSTPGLPFDLTTLVLYTWRGKLLFGGMWLAIAAIFVSNGTTCFFPAFMGLFILFWGPISSIPF